MTPPPRPDPSPPPGPPPPPTLVRVAWDYHDACRRVGDTSLVLGRLRSERKALGEEYARRLAAEHPPGQLHLVDFDGVSYGCRPQPDGKGVHREKIGGGR